ncbi:MAG: hypothetical protein LVQ95_01430 [Candidatus Micrarchaeales archaeon]|nr:hypothetical protein [Candidatus Micrarchaeales archaeon]
MKPQIKKLMFPLIILFVLASTATAGIFSPVLLQTQQISFVPFIANAIVIAVLAILVVIAVAALVYLISNIIDSANARAWARFQIYQAIVSGLVLLAFGVLLVFALMNPQGVLGPFGLNLIPNNQQVSPLQPASHYQCEGAPDIFQLATCDLGLFNSNAFSFFETVFMASMIFGISGGITASISPTASTGVVAKVKLSATSLMPTSIEDLTSFIFQVLLFFIFFSNFLLIIVAGSLLFLTYLVIIGLIARTFGLTRTFGGAMISLGLGLGIVLPLMVAIIYGFLDVQIGPIWWGTLIYQVFGLIYWMLGLIFGGGTFGATHIIFQFAALIAGLTFMPFIIFAVVDTFIIDFSKAIGEKLDFMSLLTGLI